ncbi:prolyl 4-hydroxylase subunit alpha-2-like isoform X1 [Drosophila takahashii]|uniref:prolyl 4-hydroxylase subunit alpha-2-like isoform X1 n=2 Tax=Drosophila takahashii TaxID=29030 RepID=UPI001CF8A2C8|nr:prolyl 4-hydroxylase subunit alpha-2-like [Drosophila takahashii]
MLIGGLVHVGILFLTLTLGQVHEEDTQQRFSRSVVNMDDLLNIEDYLVLNLENFAELLFRKARTIRWGIYQMRKIHQKLRESRKFVFNPFESYSLIRHMQSDWLMWEFFLKKPVAQEQLSYMKTMKSKLPQDRDFFDAAEGIRKVQATYKISSTDMANGLLDGVQYNSTLASLDCLAMCEHLVKEWRLQVAEEWILSGIETTNRVVSQTELQLLRGSIEPELHRCLGKARMKQKKYEGALEAYKIVLKHSPHDSNIFTEYLNLESRVLSGLEPIEYKEEEDVESDYLPTCCSGRCEVPQKLRNLYCVYNHVTAPFLRLSPIKMEILSIDPFVVILHDMISPKDSALIRSSSKKHLLPSATVDVGAPKGQKKVAEFRTSKSVWYDYDHNEATRNMNKRLGDATGLDIRFAEFFQVINYGLGGFFNTHMDTLLSDKARFNGGYDRIATAVFYLSDVPQGGGTYFPKLNITVFPKAGSTLFWYNLDTKGNDHLSTRHTGCPVLVGSKWVVSKWILDIGQEFTRPCIDSISKAKYLASAEKLII